MIDDCERRKCRAISPGEGGFIGLNSKDKVPSLSVSLGAKTGIGNVVYFPGNKL